MYCTQALRAVASVTVCALLVLAPSAAADVDALPAGLETTIRAELQVERFTLAQLDLPEEAGESIASPISLAEVEYELLLDAHSLRSPEFRVLVPDTDGTMRQVAVAAPRTYRGALAERPDSRIAASLSEAGLTAVIVFEDDVWGVQPLRDFQPDADRAAHIVYRQEDALPVEGTCGTDILAPLGDLDPADVDGGDGFDTRGTDCLHVAEIAFDADFEFFQRNGSSVDQTIVDVERVLNGVEVIYERDVGITYELATVIVRDSEPDPYSSSDPSTLLGQFRSEWRDHQSGVRRDVAHLMTGRNLSGSTIGIAFLGVVCSQNRGYGLSQSRFSSLLTRRVGLTAHEVGHNWNAVHCNGDPDCKIMCSGLGGCAGSVTSFGARSINDISAFRDGRPCLVQDGLVILTQPEPSQDVCLGELASLSITVDAAAPVYQWRVGSTDLVDDGVHIFGATSPNLLIVDVTAEHDADNYACVVTDTITGCSATSDLARINVDTNVPVILGQPVDRVVSIGDSVAFSVTVEDPFLATYQWRKDGAPLTDDGRLNGTTTATMFILSTEPGDAGQYDCVITSTFGGTCSVISDSATLSFESGGCPEDLDGDGDVDLSDLSALLASFGATGGVGPEDGDLDGDGDVDLADLSALLAVFGSPCP